MIGLFNEAELRSACKVLFGNDLDPPVEFFSYLQPEGVKAAFRKRARETHPDCCAGHSARHATPPEAFHRVTEAYNVLSAFVKQKRPAMANTPPKERHQPRKSTNDGHVYHHGPLPRRHLEIGRYLYYRGVISYQSLISALVWQRSQRPTLGRIARNWGLLTDEAVQAILSCKKFSGFFGEKAVRNGLLTEHQLSLLLTHQRSKQQKLGKYFIQSGYLTDREMEALILDMHKHNAQIRNQQFRKAK
ncbi:DnaJ domain-containing protein [Geobacter pelophilus]|uniref:DnaJ domain-containing protein n=1 Tax=Geoanaerobacter pelophilus TaxID=60036 RepID=A0AAW4L319_9BACT|nr:DnaJ domain-containing protein [Geoanaerobacter pelophilus]MBT0663890.1 DnaJ domain-containing protein [Geoanaerobacter pelophilus]